MWVPANMSADNRTIVRNSSWVTPSQGVRYQVVRQGRDVCTGATRNMSCPLLARLGVSSSMQLKLAYTGRGGPGPPNRMLSNSTGGPGPQGTCAQEGLLPAGERRVCGWAGVSPDQCRMIGCCWFGPEDAGGGVGRARGGAHSPFCAQRT